VTGLTAAEVRERVAAGRTNTVRSRTSRPVAEILRTNLLTWFNLVLGTLLVLILLYGSWRDGLFGLVLVANSAIGIAQELRAKRTLDRLALITAPRATVIRDGTPTEVAVADVVLDDVVALGPGDQLVVDGEVLSATGLELDESALTGEANPVSKMARDEVRSGSFVVAGSGLCRATAVGEDAWAARVERIGRRFTRADSEIMRGITVVLQVIGALLVPVGALTIARNTQGAETATAVTDTVAALVAMVPEGLVLLSSVAFAVSGLALARRHVLVNELPAVELLARTDVVCVDKTGTLTEREPTFGRFVPLDAAVDADLLADGALPADAGLLADAALHALGALARADPNPNATLRAIAAAVPPSPGWEATGTVPFSSARKWSAIAGRGSWVLGAPEIVANGDTAGVKARARAAELAGEGLRVLLLSHTQASLDGETLPGGLTPVGLVILSERVRPDAAQTLAYFQEQDVEIKVISGDNPATVATIAAIAGVPGADKALDARMLPDGDALADIMETTTVFGRVDPDQKRAMVEALQSRGHTVAMTGDGVNDAMALKRADIGVAMGITGTDVAKGTADMILTDDNFATIVEAVEEGRVIYSNIRKFVAFLLSCNVGEILVIFITTLAMGPSFVPLVPIQLLWLNLVTDSFPALALGREKGEPGVMNLPPRSPKEPILNKDMIITIIIQAIAIFGAVFAAFKIGIAQYPGLAENGVVLPSVAARTYAFVTLIMCELIRSFSARSERVPVLKIGLFTNKTVVQAFLLSVGLTLVVVYVPFLQTIFKTVTLGLNDWFIILPLALIPFTAGELSKWIRGLVRGNA